MNIWLMMVIGGLLTYLMRAAFIVLFGREEMPKFVLQALRFVPPAVFSAIIFPNLLINGGKVEISFENSRLLAGCIAVFVAWRTRNTVLTIIVGLLVLWFLQGRLMG